MGRGGPLTAGPGLRYFSDQEERRPKELGGGGKGKKRAVTPLGAFCQRRREYGMAEQKKRVRPGNFLSHVCQPHPHVSISLDKHFCDLGSLRRPVSFVSPRISLT